MNKIPLSVIIPVFNSEKYLDKLIKTIIDDVAEIIICDSFSTDSTLEIAKSHYLKIIQKKYINSKYEKS